MILAPIQVILRNFACCLFLYVVFSPEYIISKDIGVEWVEKLLQISKKRKKKGC